MLFLNKFVNEELYRTGHFGEWSSNHFQQLPILIKKMSIKNIDQVFTVSEIFDNIMMVNALMHSKLFTILQRRIYHHLSRGRYFCKEVCAKMCL